jgi:segregation and condensation protein A
VVPDSDYRIKLQVFEGPLDLLLFLIRKNELDIYDIPIESVTKQYIEALHTMQQLDLEVAGEFFVMAATLMEIKSRLLLPKGQHAVDPNAEDEEVDPRWELVHQLLQYKKFKEAATQLAELAETRQNLMARHVSSLANEDGDRPLKNVDRIELWNTFNIVLRRLAEKLVVGEIHDEVVTVSDQMEWLLERIKSETSFVFSQLFPDGVTLRRLVATFLAMLELTRLKKLRIRQSEAFTDIVVEAVVDVSILENPLETTGNPPTVAV